MLTVFSRMITKNFSFLKQINLPPHLCIFTYIYIHYAVYLNVQYYEITELVIVKTYTTWLSGRESLACHCTY